MDQASSTKASSTGGGSKNLRVYFLINLFSLLVYLIYACKALFS
jgi:hypothetical protein